MSDAERISLLARELDQQVEALRDIYQALAALQAKITELEAMLHAKEGRLILMLPDNTGAEFKWTMTPIPRFVEASRREDARDK